MRTRALYKYTDEQGKEHTNVVWFGSTGRKQKGFDNAIWDSSIWDSEQGKAVFYDDKHTNFSEKQQSVVDGLTQRLSIVKGELWYAMSYGLPLFDRNRSKVEFDSFILKTITSHPDVDSVISFVSQVLNAHYTCNVKIQSKYGPIDINL